MNEKKPLLSEPPPFVPGAPPAYPPQAGGFQVPQPWGTHAAQSPPHSPPPLGYQQSPPAFAQQTMNTAHFAQQTMNTAHIAGGLSVPTCTNHPNVQASFNCNGCGRLFCMGCEMNVTAYSHGSATTSSGHTARVTVAHQEKRCRECGVLYMERQRRNRCIGFIFMAIFMGFGIGMMIIFMSSTSGF